MKKLGLILIGALAFDLGTVVASSHAAVDLFLKLDGVHENGFTKIKLDKVNNADACRAHGGTILTSSGQDFCSIPESKDDKHNGELAHPTTGGAKLGGPH